MDFHVQNAIFGIKIQIFHIFEDEIFDNIRRKNSNQLTNSVFAVINFWTKICVITQCDRGGVAS